MTTFENAPPLPDWSLPPRSHCGEWYSGVSCDVCGEYVPKIPANIELGCE